MANNQTFAVVLAARLFALVAIGAPILWLRQTDALASLLVLTFIWLYQGITAIRRDLQLSLSPTTEAAAVGVLCALGMQVGPSLLAALVVPPLYATAMVGLRTMVRAVLVEFVAVVALALMWWEQITSEQGVSIFTWVMAGVGLSLIASVTFASDRVPDALAPYRDAQEHLQGLLALSGGLSSGLDLTSLGGALLSEVGDRVPHRGSILYVLRGETLAPTVSSGEMSEADRAECARLAHQVLTNPSAGQVESDNGFASWVSDQTIVAGLRPESVEGRHRALNGLARQVADSAVKLDTALLFAQFRSAATADERSRLAREMHDGVAQDIASIGYLVDALAARPADEQQAKALELLRERVSVVVAEVRQSVLNLRTSIGEAESLGAALGNVARHLSEASGIPIRVRLDEQPARLRPEVEAELFRITQEAMNNAVKHARATTIDVRCQVYAPDAVITVTDNGVGMQAARRDSHGLKIMRERARLIGAHLVVRDNASRGLTVSVSVSTSRSTSRHVETQPTVPAHSTTTTTDATPTDATHLAPATSQESR
ncbi:MAG: sensor histidine kinase [Nocardioidaceae bacterium]|nr:sensor histidine kinase [Nocardioidaceae bacterium]